MSYDEKAAERVRRVLAAEPHVRPMKIGGGRRPSGFEANKKASGSVAKAKHAAGARGSVN
jgi:hypothetical protein